MGRVKSEQIRDGEIKRPDLNTNESGQAVIAKVIAGEDITITETGADSGTGDVTINANVQPSIMCISGKWDLFNSENWVSWSDPTFGPNQQDWDLQLGNGAEPSIDWDGMGMFFPAGTILKKAVVKYRGNNTDIDSIITFARVHDVDLFDDQPIDSNGEIGAVTISPATTIDLDFGAKNANDVAAFEIDLNDYQFVNNGDLHLILRPTPGSLTGNRQLRCTMFIEYYLPRVIA